jgi:chaperonin GroEL
MSKRIITREQLIDPKLKGLTAISSVVKRTLGPGGLLILIERVGQTLEGLPLGPKITKDGVSVAEECASIDKAEDIIIQAVKGICRKTVSTAGDGPQPLYSKVLTPKGFIEMRDVRVGMVICGTNGTVQKVLGVFPKGQKEIYEVEIQNKGIVECCEDHVWSVTKNSNGGADSVKSVAELIKDYKKEGIQSTKYNYYIPKTPVYFQENTAEMPLDPYLLGVLLGDGCLKDGSSIELGLGVKKEHILQKLKPPKGINTNIQFVESRNYFRVKFSGISETGKSMRDYVESLGLRDAGSFTKFIPKSYLYASIETRSQVLQGLIDTDGCVNERGLFEFSTGSKELATDLRDLVLSLGKTVHMYLRDRSNDNAFSKTPMYRIGELKGFIHGDKIKEIKATGRFTEMQCIKVSNPDSLYITDNYVVTHNTTTAMVLGEAIVNETERILKEDTKLNPQLVRESLEEASLQVIKKLKKIAIKVNNNKTIQQVATISANGDESIGDIIAAAFAHVGAEGVVTVDEGHTSKVTLDVVDGYQFNRGAEGRTAFFNNRDATQFEAEDAALIIYDGKLYNYTQLIPALKLLAGVGADEKASRKMPPTVIVANEFSPEVLQFLLIQKTEMGMTFCPITGPNTTHVRSGYYDDLAVYSGGTRLGNGARNLESIEMDDIGLVKRALSDKYKTTLYDGQGSEESILERVDQLKAAKAQAESPYDAQILNDRLASLTNGIAKIGVGGTTEMEIKEKYDRIEDALNAARAAIEEGVVPGGGTTLLRIALEMPEKTVGQKILKVALQAPFFQILENIGIFKEEALEVSKTLVKSKSKVYDARTKQIKNAMTAGIIDPVKVTRTALENAVSIATLLSTCGGAITYEK